MKIRFHHSFAALALLTLSMLGLELPTARAQGTPQGAPFLYRGHLKPGLAVANGTYDMAISLFETNQGGSAVAGPVINSAIKVDRGLFYVNLDFGAGPFPGTNYWLDISVRPTGSNIFTALSARQRLAPSPYALSEPRLKTSVLKLRPAGQAAQLLPQDATPAAAQPQATSSKLPPVAAKPALAPKSAPTENQ
jgi:hypothetical protein